MNTSSLLLAADRHNSPSLAAPSAQRSSYCPFGYQKNPAQQASGFNGQFQDQLTGHYLLGNGYRIYSPVLRRYCSPDSLSPFGKGGLNAYIYCEGDPINHTDPSGHMGLDDFLKNLRKISPENDLIKHANIVKSLHGNNLSIEDFKRLATSEQISAHFEKRLERWEGNISTYLNAHSELLESGRITTDIYRKFTQNVNIHQRYNLDPFLQATEATALSGAQANSTRLSLGLLIPGLSTLPEQDILTLRTIYRGHTIRQNQSSYIRDSVRQDIIRSFKLARQN